MAPQADWTIEWFAGKAGLEVVSESASTAVAPSDKDMSYGPDTAHDRKSISVVGSFCYTTVMENDAMRENSKALVIDPRDNVATALDELRAGTVVAVLLKEGGKEVVLCSDIPAGHKFAITEIAENGNVVKYGEVIGRSVQPIAEGEHVHVHNVISPRKRE